MLESMDIQWHQEEMLSNKLRQYVASNTKLGRCNVRVNGYE